MAKASSPTTTPPDGSTTNIDVAKNQHGFSGKTCQIKLFKGEPHEPVTPFFGINGYQITIQREKWVTVPVEMADHIESLTYTVREPDPDEPENLNKMQWVDKSRFPLQRKD